MVNTDIVPLIIMIMVGLEDYGWLGLGAWAGVELARG